MSDQDAKRRRSLVDYVESLGVKNVMKDESRLMRLIGWVLFFNRAFMTGFITTIGQTIYWPRETWESDRTVWQVLPHEFMHAMDFRRLGLLVTAFIYLFPQVLGFLIPLSALGAFYDLNFLWGLLGLVLLAPFPAYGRKYIEMRGYVMTLATEVWADPNLKREEAPLWITRHFTGWNYYLMWPFRKSLEKEFQQWLAWINDGTIDQKIPIAKVIRNKIQGAS